jgi:hypothetical protein
MTFAKIWRQIKSQWSSHHQGEENQVKENAALRQRVDQLEKLLLAHNLDPNTDIDSERHRDQS